MSEMTLQRIVRRLRSWLPWRRSSAVRALRRLHDPEGVEALIPLLGGPDQEARVGARMALERMGRAAVPRLVAALADENLSVRHGAAWVLGRLGKRKLALAVTRALSGEAASVAGYERAVRPLAVALNEPGLRSVAATALAAVGEHAVPTLCRALRSAEPETRIAAVGALGRVGGHRALRALGQAARHDPDPDTQAAAVRALGAAGRPALGELVRCLRAFEAPWKLAAETLGEMGEAAVPSLRQEILSTDAHTRRAAATALGMTGDPRALEPLVRALSDEENVVCLSAALGLGHLGALAAPAVPALHELGSSAVGDVRWGARHAIDLIEAALRGAPAELESAPPPAGRGTELEASPPAAGRGTELEAGGDEGV